MKGLILFALLYKAMIRMKNLSQELTGVSTCIAYLKALKFLRTTALYFIGMAFCMTLFVSGMVILHIGILFYAPWPQSVRVTVTFIFAFVYVFLSGGIFLYLLSQKKWMQIFYADRFTSRVCKPLI